MKYLSCVAAALFSFYNLFLFSLFNTISTDLLSAFNLNTTSLGFLSSCDLWANALGLIPIGILLDRYSVRWVGLCLLTLAIIATFIMSISTSYSILCAMRFFQGLASACSLLITMRLGSTLFKKNANIAIGLMITLALSGGIMGNSIFAHIVQHIGWRHALITASIVGIFCLLIAFIFLKDFSHNPKKSIPYSSALNKKNILFGTVLGLINLPVFVVGSLWGNYYLIQAYHLSMTQAASFSTLIFAGIIIGSPCWGFVADKILNPKIILLFGGVILLLLSILVSIKILSLYLLALLFLGLGFFCSVQNLIYPLIGKTNNPTLTSTSTAVAALISNSIGAGMQIASPLLFIGLWNLLSTFSNLHHFF